MTNMVNHYAPLAQQRFSNSDGRNPFAKLGEAMQKADRDRARGLKQTAAARRSNRKRSR